MATRTATTRTATYDTIKPGSGTANEIPQGRYTAILVGAVLQEPTENGQSLRLSFVVCDDEYEGTEVPTWFKFYRADSSINEFAISLWKTALAKLQYEDVKESELPQLLEQISEDKPGVVIKVGYQIVKGYANPLQRVEVEALCDNDIVAKYRETHQAEF